MPNLKKTTQTMRVNGAKLVVVGVFTFGLVPAKAALTQAAVQGPQVTTSTSISTDGSSPLTFQGWKSLRVDEARLVLERLTYESQLDKVQVIDRSPGERQPVIRNTESNSRAMAPRTTKTGRAESRAEQARMNLEIAQDLTVNDYLVIYLSQFKSREAILDVARRFAPDDIADLLQSYQKLSMGGQIAEHSISPPLRTPPRPL